MKEERKRGRGHNGGMTVTEDTEMELTSPKLTERWQERVRKSAAERDGQKKKKARMRKVKKSMMKHIICIFSRLICVAAAG